MKNSKQFSRFCYFMIFVLTLGLAGCGGGGGSPDSGSGIVLNITDAPVIDEDIAEVWVRFTQVIVHPSDGSPDVVVDVVNDEGDAWRDIELKSLVDGKTMLLGEVPLEAKSYSWIRLVIDPLFTRIKETGQDPEIYTRLDCSSCDESHLKLNRSFTIGDTGWINFTIDFNLQKSLTLQLPHSVKPRPDYAYKLRPTLRILETELASTFIWGSVTDTRAFPADPADPTGCKVYTYESDVPPLLPVIPLPVIPDDICVDVGCPVANNQRPWDTVAVTNNGGTFEYSTGFLYPDSTYVIALVCEADDNDFDESLVYMSVTEVVTGSASAFGDGPYPLVLSDVAALTLDKSITGGDLFTNVGDIISYDYLVTNTGNVTVTGLAVSDDKVDVLGSVSCLVASLAPAESTTCTATYAVVQGDVDAGFVTNTATASGDGGVVSNEDMATATDGV